MGDFDAGANVIDGKMVGTDMGLTDPRPCRKCGRSRDYRSPEQGRYSRLCADCRAELAQGIRDANQRANGKPPIVAAATGTGAGVDLPKVVQQAVVPARRFQKAIEQRHSAKLEAQAALLELNGSLRAIQEAARRLMNGHEGNSRVEAELEQESAA